MFLLTTSLVVTVCNEVLSGGFDNPWGTGALKSPPMNGEALVLSTSLFIYILCLSKKRRAFCVLAPEMCTLFTFFFFCFFFF